MLAPEIIAHAATAFGWGEAVTVTAGPRGALGQIWRVDVGRAHFALKEIFDEVPTEDVVRRELEFTGRASEFGVTMPALIPDVGGNYVVRTPTGDWLRCYEWVDLRAVPATPELPQRLGTLLASLHRCAPVTAVEPDGGGPVDPWYTHPPEPGEWSVTATSAEAWAADLRAQLPAIADLTTCIRQPDPARQILCHRDLHPENVFVDGAGQLVVVDWGDFGPAVPGQELARVLFDWFCSRDGTDLDAIRTMVGAYRDHGGPGRITELADFSMLLACRLNFLLAQVRIATDESSEQRHREWAECEITVGLHLLPTQRQLDDVLACARACFG